MNILVPMPEKTLNINISKIPTVDHDRRGKLRFQLKNAIAGPKIEHGTL